MFGENQTRLQKLLRELGELEQLQRSLTEETPIETIRDRALKAFPNLFSSGFSQERLIEEIQLRRGEKERVETKKLRFNIPGESSSESLVPPSPGSTTPKSILTRAHSAPQEHESDEGRVANLSYQIADAIDKLYLSEVTLAAFKEFEGRANQFIRTGAELIAELECEKLKSRTFQLLFELVGEIEEISTPFTTPSEKLNYIAQAASIGFAIAYSKEKKTHVNRWVKKRVEGFHELPNLVALFQEKLWFVKFRSRVTQSSSEKTLRKIEKKHADWIGRIGRLNQKEVDTIEGYIQLSMHLEEMRERLTGVNQRVSIGRELKLLAPAELIPEIDRWIGE